MYNNLDLLEQSVSIIYIQTLFFQMTGDDNDTMDIRYVWMKSTSYVINLNPFKIWGVTHIGV